jgi:hypothetical protein
MGDLGVDRICDEVAEENLFYWGGSCEHIGYFSGVIKCGTFFTV